MNSKKAVRKIMERKGIGTKQMADMLGSNMQMVVDRLSEGKGTNISIEKLNEFLRLLDYKIILMPKEEECREGWYEVDSEPTIAAVGNERVEKSVSKNRKKTKKGVSE